MNGENAVQIDITAQSLADKALNDTIRKVNEISRATDNAAKSAALMKSNANNIYRRLAAEAELAAKKTNKISESLRRMYDTQAQASRRLRAERFKQLSVETQLDKMRERELRVERALKRENLSDLRRSALSARLSQLRSGIVNLAPQVKPPVLNPKAGGGGFGGLLSLLGERYGSLFGKFGLAGAGAYGAYRVLRGSIGGAMDLTQNATAAGVNTSQYQTMAEAARRSNMDTGDVTGAYGNFKGARDKALSGSLEMQNAFAQLGITMSQLSASNSFDSFKALLGNLAKSSGNASVLANAFKIIGENAEKFASNRFAADMNAPFGQGIGTTAELNNAGQAAEQAVGIGKRVGSVLLASGSANLRRASGYGAKLLSYIPGGIGQWWGQKSKGWLTSPDITASNAAETQEGLQYRADRARAADARYRRNLSRMQQGSMGMMQDEYERLMETIRPEQRRLSGLANVGLYTSRGGKSYAENNLQAISKEQLNTLKEIKQDIMDLEKIMQDGLN